MSTTHAGTRGVGGGLLRWTVKIAVSAGLMVFLLRKISLPELERLIRTMDPVLLVSAVAVFVVSNVAGWLQWHVLLSAGGISAGRARTFGFYNVGLFFNNFLPANIGGDAVKVYDVTRLGGSVYHVIAVTLLDRLLGVFSLCVLAIAADLFLIAREPTPYAYYLALFAACMLPAIGFYFFRPLGNAFRRAVLRVRPLALDRRITSIIDHLSPFKGRRALVARLVAFSILIQMLRVLTHVLVGMAMGVTMDFHVLCQFFVFVPILSLAMIPPVTINGLGIREGLGILLFAQAGIGRTDAFAMEFVTYIISVLASLVGLGFFLARRVGGPPGSPSFRA
ncbi:MAG: flippase-like domain-containing protein [Candidatus Krumholzibacteria bacterium]|nr:flippase-like domain-containing protein [Candidatus Krumholzibacteria bacterium]MDH4336695.1 flippase-like domain-containing protein [Candidatus Krumholzibacteria bacterium]MDH5270816.1 flippase-like domain-containing protein [Candidatus Krumholzibacteria bacterium]MDH5627577.1 flippase-like domain-containing protein [Candidatus Krumholzibacteria bacterium]